MKKQFISYLHITLQWRRGRPNRKCVHCHIILFLDVNKSVLVSYSAQTLNCLVIVYMFNELYSRCMNKILKLK